jgi:hypothetical protein
MSTDRKFAPRSLTASRYVLELFGPEDNAAILVRNRSTGHTFKPSPRLRPLQTPIFNLG